MDPTPPEPTALETSALDQPAEPAVPTSAELQAGPPIKPEQRIWLYDGDEWENFILEWATGLSAYEKVEKIAGTGDRGVDVAGFYTNMGFEGDWDCLQGKHYAKALEPNHVWPEILKVIESSMDGYGLMPRAHLFFSPKGPARLLRDYINMPSRMREAFFKALQVGKPLSGKRNAARISEIKNFLADDDFSRYGFIDLAKLLETHKKTRYHAVRFGEQLPTRPADETPPEEIAQKERRYVEQLLDVYGEEYGATASTLEGARDHPVAGEHLPRQRQAFYCAESLRVFARDSVPAGTYERLMDDVYDGVVEVEQQAHSSGYARLSAVLIHVSSIDLSSSALISSSRQRDRRGLCHQLANDDRLVWMRVRESSAAVE